MILNMFQKSLLLAGVVFACAIHAVGQQTQPPQTSTPATKSESTDAVSVQQDVEFGVQSGEKLLLDLYLPTQPSSTPRPAVLMIHGGGWDSLDKSTMRGMGNFLARSGFVAVSANYRLLHGSENRWPAQLDDVQRAVRWLRANAAKYNIDPEHIGAYGHSAGAQLAALLGMVDTRDNADPALAKYSSRVQAVVDVSGPSDFLANRNTDGEAFLAKLFGGDFSKLSEVWRSASPVFNVAKSNAPFLIVHGTHDDNVPLAQAQELYEKLQQAGVPVNFVKLEDGHTFTTPEARHRLAAETHAFFNTYLMPSR
jgi:acetyl esterase/lipase